mgnify:CR=1 FL=1
MTKKQKKLLQRITAAAVLFAAGMLLPLFAETSEYIIFALFGISYIIIGWDIIWKAFCNIRQGEAFDENFLMTVATPAGAFVLGEYSEGVAVMLFYQIGEWFQSYAVSRSRQSITALMDIRPDYANVEDENGKLEQRWVQTGKVVWDSYTQIRGGLTPEDYVAFPYGRDVVSGAKTEEATVDALYSW